MESQLTILAESLDKKLEVLKEIMRYNEEQEKSLASNAVDLDSFDAAAEKKGKLIDKLQRLDAGFETMYAGLSKELMDNRETYKEQIRLLQQKVTEVTELSVSVMAQEKRNKKLVEGFFAKERESIRSNRKTSKAAYDYYRNMNRSDYVPPQFMDSKK